MSTENQEINTDSRMDTDVKMDTASRAELRQQCDNLLERVEAMLAYLHTGATQAEYAHSQSPSSPVKP